MAVGIERRFDDFMPRLHWNVLQVLSLLNEHRRKKSPQIIRFVFRPFDQLAVFFDRFSQTCFHARDEKYSAEQRGGKLKKKRQIDVIEAEIENGIADASDPPLKDPIAALRTDRDIAKGADERAGAELRPETRINPERIAAVTDLMCRSALSWAAAQRRPERRVLFANGGPVRMKLGTGM